MLNNEEKALSNQDLGAKLKVFGMILAVAFGLYHIFALQFLIIDPLVLRGGFLAGAALLTFVYWVPPLKGWLGRGIDILMSIGIVGSAIYIVFNYSEMVYRVGISPTFWDTVFGTIALIVTLEITRRTLGIGLPILAILAIVYVFVGDKIPGAYGHGGFSFDRAISIMFSSSGLFGIPISVAITYVLPFVIFGAFLEVNGTGQVIMDLSKSIAGRMKGGAAQIATTSSALFGSINGSPVANVVSTGVITIPMMKRGGYSPVFAGAVEAVASTGGQILPPVMGASAFIMMEILGTSYATIAFAALVPALLYYVAVYWTINLEAGRTGLKPLDKSEIPHFGKLLIQKGHMLLPLIVLVVCLLGYGMSPMRSAIYGIIAALIVPMFKKETRMSWIQILQAIAIGSKNTVTVATACAAAGVIVGVLGMTGIGHQFADIVLGLSGGYLFTALLLTALVALVLGVGMPTTGAYIVTAAVLPMALIPLGVNPLAIHLFLLYFANISNITPPVALASFAAAGLADTSPMKVGIKSLQLGFVGFIIPFMFVYSPALLLEGSLLEILKTTLFAALGILAFAVAVQGWYRIQLLAWERIALTIAAFCLVKQGLYTDLTGTAIIIITMILLFKRKSKIEKVNQVQSVSM